MGDSTANPWQREQSLLIALSAMPVGVSWATLADQKIVYMNRKFTEIFGYVVGDFPYISDWIGAYPVASDRSMASARWGEYFENPDGYDRPVEPMELSIACRDGTVKTILSSGIILPNAGWALATFIDISERKKDELLIREAEKRARENQAIYRALLDQSQEMVVISTFSGTGRYVSPAVCKITGWTAGEYLAMPVKRLVHPDDFEAAMQALQEIAEGKPYYVRRYRAAQKVGGYRWVESTVRPYMDPDSTQPVGYVATIRDVDEQKKREDQLALEYRQLSEYASCDELTGIPNRRLFNQTLDREVRRQTRTTQAMALLMLDVDHFKQYNDYYGHLPGDCCLKRIAAALKKMLRREADLVARFGGEEFVMLLPMTEPDGAENIAREILEAIRELEIPHVRSALGRVTISIGAACWPPGIPIDSNRLLQAADEALYRSKRSGRNTFSMIQCAVPAAA